MIILIAGGSCTGKTLLADKIMRKYAIPYYSMDHLKMGLFRAMDDCGFTPLDSNEHIGSKLWPILREMIKTAIENNQNLIIEGAYLLPEYLKEFEEIYMDHVLPIFIAFTENYIRASFDSGIIKHRSVIEKRIHQENRDVEALIKENLTMIRYCDDSNTNCFIIEKDYMEEMENVIHYIQRNINI
jgi:2-phosphoglycerate kinase